MGSTTIPGGGGNTGHGFHIFGDSSQGHQGGGFSFQGHGPHGFGKFGFGTEHRHVGNSYGVGVHQTSGNGTGQSHAERFGLHNQTAAVGHDTISLGAGHDTLVDAGRATGAHFGYHVSTHHSATMAGGAHHTTFVAGGHTLSAHGAASVAGGTSHVTAHFTDAKSHTDVIKNFVAGHAKLQLESQALSYLNTHVDVTVNHGQTLLSLDGGHTTVALKGFSHSSGTHKG